LGRVHGFQLWQDLRSNHPYTLWTNKHVDVVRGTVITFDDLDVFYDRLQVCDLIEEHNPHGTSKSVYERTIVEVHTDDGEIINAYIYYMEPDAQRASTSLSFPDGDWLTTIRSLRGELD